MALGLQVRGYPWVSLATAQGRCSTAVRFQSYFKVAP